MSSSDSSLFPEVHSFLNFNADCIHPRQGIDVANIFDYIEIASTLQKRLEGPNNIEWREQAMGSGRQASLLARLTFWFSCWFDADNVVAITSILAYHLALTNGGGAAIRNAQMPPYREEEEERETQETPHRSFLTRLFFATHSVIGRDFPHNSLIAAARTSSLIIVLCEQIDSVYSIQDTRVLFMQGTLNMLTTVIAVTADRPNKYPLTNISASVEARRALESLASLSFRHLNHHLNNSHSSMMESNAEENERRVFQLLVRNSLSVPLSASTALSRVALTPASASLLCEVARNTIAGLIQVYARVHSLYSGQDNPFIYLSFPLSDFDLNDRQPPLGITLILAFINGIVKISAALVNNDYMVAITESHTCRSGLQPQQQSICAHATLTEHLLLALYNVYANVDVRTGIVFASDRVAADMTRIMRGALRTLSVQLDLAVVVDVDTATDYGDEIHLARMSATLRAAQAASMLLVYPLSYMPVLDHALTMLWADNDGVEILSACLHTIARDYWIHCNRFPRNTLPPAAQEWRQLFISIVNVVQLMLRGSGVVRAGRGTLNGNGNGPGRDEFATLLYNVNECIGLFYTGTFDTIRARPSESEATILYALVGRASNFDSTAWGAFPLTQNAAGWGRQWWRAIIRPVLGEAFEWATHPYGTIPRSWKPFIEILSSHIEKALEEEETSINRVQLPTAHAA